MNKIESICEWKLLYFNYESYDIEFQRHFHDFCSYFLLFDCRFQLK